MTAPARDVHGGRPLDPEISRAILDAALDLLGEEGYARLTVEGVAHRAGVHKPAVYRRWPSKADLVVAAVLSIAPPVGDPATGDLRTDLLRMLHDAAAATQSRYGRVGLRLKADLAVDPELAAAIERDVVRPRRAVARAVLRRGIESGELRGDLDVDLAIDMLYGPLHAAALLGDKRLTKVRVERVVDLVLDGLRASR